MLLLAFPMTLFSFNSLQLKALGAEGMIRELMQYLHVAENQFFRTNTYLGTPIYNTVLHSLVEAKEVSASPTLSNILAFPLDVSVF